MLLFLVGNTFGFCSPILALFTVTIRNDERKYKELETKASYHEGQCIPAGYCHAHTLLCESGVNYNVNGKYRKYFGQLRPNFYVLEYFHHTLATLVASSTDGTAMCLVSYKAHLVL